GPGITNVGRAMEDGFSSAGTAGRGLGAIRRMAADFDLYSRPAVNRDGAGTMMLARVWSAAAARIRAASAARMEVGVVCVAIAGERDCGDSWVVLHTRHRTLVAVVDGLGHGPGAAAASAEAIRVIRESPGSSPADLVHAAHGALRATRGAAMAVAAVHHGRGTVTFAGVGNIAAGLHSPDGGTRSFASHNGTVGHVVRKVQEFQHDWDAGGVLLMHSDGINTRWRLDAYPGLLHHDPALVAGAIYRDAARGRDDATVVVLADRMGPDGGARR
ncbi:MAG: SpoIIE family protein phosphatase, partial [Gemmatimonadaceae bacterium]